MIAGIVEGVTLKALTLAGPAAVLYVLAEAGQAGMADVAVIISGVFAGTLPAIVGTILANRQAKSAKDLAVMALRDARRSRRTMLKVAKLLATRTKTWDKFSHWLDGQAMPDFPTVKVKMDPPASESSESQ